ncbi:MAG: hypothetical protein U0790_25620 [Isosphaeraceae bacterium]
MDPKPRPNRERYLQVLRSMTPEQRLLKAFELGQMGKDLLRAGLRSRNPTASEEELHRMYLEALARCHNRNY